MDIENLTSQEISDKIKKYLPSFMRKSEQVKNGANLFEESYQLEYSEIKNNIPRNYRKYLKGIDTVNSMSGTIEFDGENKRKVRDYIIILLTDAESTKALLLLMQITSKRTDKSETIVLKNFCCEEETVEEKNLLMAELLKQFHSLLNDSQKTIESEMDNIISEGADEQFQKLLYNLVIQSMIILRNNT